MFPKQGRKPKNGEMSGGGHRIIERQPHKIGHHRWSLFSVHTTHVCNSWASRNTINCELNQKYVSCWHFQHLFYIVWIIFICTDNIIFAHRPIVVLIPSVTRTYSQQTLPLRSSLVSSSHDYSFSEETGQQLQTLSFHMKPKTHHYQNKQNGANKNMFTDFLGFK